MDGNGILWSDDSPNHGTAGDIHHGLRGSDRASLTTSSSGVQARNANARSAYMQTELRLHRLVVGILVALLVLFISIVMALHPSLAHQRFEVNRIACPCYHGGNSLRHDWNGRRGSRVSIWTDAQARTTGLPAARSGFACLRSISGHLRKSFNTDNSARGGSPCISLWDWRITACVSPAAPSRERRGLLINGLCEVALGVALAGAYYLSSQRAAMLLGCVAILSTIQLVPFLFYKRQSSSL